MGSLLQLAKSAGFLPRLEDLDEEQTYSMLTTLMELVRMIRDGDPTSLDENAQKMYQELDR